MKPLEFLRLAYSEKGEPSSSRIHTGFVVFSLTIALCLGFYRVCGDPSLKEQIVPFAEVLTVTVLGALGFYISKSIFGKKDPEDKPGALKQ